MQGNLPPLKVFLPCVEPRPTESLDGAVDGLWEVWRGVEGEVDHAVGAGPDDGYEFEAVRVDEAGLGGSCCGGHGVGVWVDKRGVAIL